MTGTAPPARPPQPTRPAEWATPGLTPPGAQPAPAAEPGVPAHVARAVARLGDGQFLLIDVGQISSDELDRRHAEYRAAMPAHVAGRWVLVSGDAVVLCTDIRP